MTDSTIFCNSFHFRTYRFQGFRTNDAQSGSPCNFFAYLTRGSAKICMEHKVVTVQEGEVFFIPADCKYRSYWYGEPHIEFISLGFRFLPNFENKYYDAQVLPASPDAIERMRRIAKRETLDCALIGEFYTLVGLLMPQMVCRRSGKQMELIDRVERLLLSDPALTVRELAHRCAVSESALYSAFKRHSDKSIGEVRHAILMEQAKKRLLSTDDSIEEISRALNFSSGAYFRKCFKEAFGISPREMRKSFPFRAL